METKHKKVRAPRNPPSTPKSNTRNRYFSTGMWFLGFDFRVECEFLDLISRWSAPSTPPSAKWCYACATLCPVPT
eukprot:2699862-Rhodomonas_salina.1